MSSIYDYITNIFKTKENKITKIITFQENLEKYLIRDVITIISSYCACSCTTIVQRLRDHTAPIHHLLQLDDDTLVSYSHNNLIVWTKVNNIFLLTKRFTIELCIYLDIKILDKKNKLILTCSKDNTLIIYDLKNYTCKQILDQDTHIRSFCCLEDKTIISYSRSCIKVYKCINDTYIVKQVIETKIRINYISFIHVLNDNLGLTVRIIFDNNKYDEYYFDDLNDLNKQKDYLDVAILSIHDRLIIMPNENILNIEHINYNSIIYDKCFNIICEIDNINKHIKPAFYKNNIICILDKSILMYNFEGTSICTLEGHTGDISNMLLLSHNKLLTSSNNDHTLRMWDLKTRKCIRIIKTELKYLITNIVVLDNEKIACSMRHLFIKKNDNHIFIYT
jgi:WD40 repeat protein